MRANRECWAFLGVLAFVSALGVAVRADEGKKSARLQNHFPKLAATKQAAKDRTLDTAITWQPSVREAAEKARNDGKLVYLIHVSGDFEDPEFT